MNAVSVRQAFQTAYTNNATLKTLIPGGIWEKGQIAQAAATPYASFDVKEGEILETSGKVYTQEFNTTLAVYSTAGPVAAGAINDALKLVFDWQQKAIQIPGAVNLAIKPAPVELETDPVRKNATDVEILRVSWVVNLQITRSK